MQLELCDVGSWMGAVASHLGCQGSNCLTLLAASTLPRVSDDTDPTEWRRWARLRVRLRIHAPPPPLHPQRACSALRARAVTGHAAAAAGRGGARAGPRERVSARPRVGVVLVWWHAAHIGVEVAWLPAEDLKGL